MTEKKQKSEMRGRHRFCVAPMMDWTDRHCRYFHRLLTKHARLYTEMVTVDAVLHGDRDRLLGFDAAEHPLALQLGGCEPDRLAEAARIGADLGYDEINLNVGCPSDRVQSGRFGACLMRTPQLVADCVDSMARAVAVPVTVKCRIGVDDQDPEAALYGLVDACAAAGCATFIVHARKAWLQGLSPKENRDVPPLDYDLVRRLKRDRPSLAVVLNGGVRDLPSAEEHLAVFDGVMLGRAAYDDPYLLAGVDRMLFSGADGPSRTEVAQAMSAYVARHVAAGGAAHHVARHMSGLFRGEPGARAWRRALCEEGAKAGPDVIARALAAMAAETQPAAAE
ncbi:MAG: tRNA dihydrouridine(20/20a) synthase DusA [Pseudomonadota bacterium]